MIGAASRRDTESRPGRRARVTARALASAPLLLLLALISAARCYPPGTRVVVFMQGIYTSYDAGGPQASYMEPHRFDTLKAAFVGKGYGTTTLLDFSYAGGTVDGPGAWLPAPYTCDATDRSPGDNLAPLEEMLAAYRQKHPGAHFTLVGHSLGGYLAFLEGAREAARPDSEKLGVDVVVTLDAPLKGISADKKTIIDLMPCVKTYLAGADLVAARLNPGTPDVRRYQAAVMAGHGVRLATLGNSFDCLYNTPHCTGGGFTDDSDTQFLSGEASITKDYQFDTALAFASHDAILTNQDAVRDTVAFVGAP